MTLPYWQTAPRAPRPALRGEVHADVCVVGAGIGGLAAAWHLLERGVRPVVVDARGVAHGASGRNGGFFIAGAAPMYHETRNRWGGERARRVHAATLRAQEAMLAVAGEIGADACFRRVGMLRLAVDAREAQDVLAHATALREDGFPGELLDAGSLPPVLRRPERLGLFFPGDGAVHPVSWLEALAQACERRGAVVFENSPARLEEEGDDPSVVCDGGRVVAGRVVVAMDAELARLVPAAAAVRPRRLHMLATAPVPGHVLPFPVYARYGYEYAQQLPDGTITLGGFSDLDGPESWTDREEASAVVHARLERYLAEELGVRATVTHRWVGLVGYSPDALPRCGEVPGSSGRVFALGGYNGTGHVQAWVAAGVVADLLSRGASDDGSLYAPVGA